MNKTLKFGILGAGMAANLHATALKDVECAELVGIADASTKRAEEFADKYGVRAFSSFDEMLKGDLDAICICTPSYYHADNAIAAMRAGKHVIIEKPMALSVEDADRIIAVSRETGRLVSVVSQFRFSENFTRLKSAIDNGEFGKISLCTLTMKYYRSEEYYSSSDWKGTLKYDGGGALMNQGIHGVDLVQYLMGGVKRASGRVATLYHNIETEDTAVASVEFENGALGVIVGSTCATPGFARTIEINGDRGYAIFKENSFEKFVIDGKEIEVQAKVSINSASDPAALDIGMHTRQLTNFVRAIFGEEKLLIDGDEGKKAVKIITDIYASSKNG